MKITKGKPSGVLAELLANIDYQEVRHTRKRMLLAIKIEAAMKRTGYSQKEFAKKMGRSATVISEWLSGDRNFTIDTLVDIEEVLGVSLINTSTMTTVPSTISNSLKVSSKSRVVTISGSGTWALKQNADTILQPQYAI